MKTHFYRNLCGVLGSSLLVLTGCGGGGSAATTGDSISGLELPSKMNMVSAESAAGRSYAGRGYALDEMALSADYAARMVDSAVTSAFPADADYYLDAADAQTWVWDPSMESLSIINEILCNMEQTAAREMVNEGAYIALVNEDKCIEGVNQSSASSGGAQSSAASSQSVEYSKWTVLSTRADNDSAQIVKIWIPGNTGASDPMDKQRILVTTTITEGVSSSKPYGSFVMNFTGEAPLQGSFVEMMQGTLRTLDNADGKPEFSFFNTAGGGTMPFSRIEKSRVVMDDATGSSGQAKTYMYESFVEQGSPHVKENGFAVAYNSDLFLRGKDTDGDDVPDDEVCTSRSAFSTQTWRYNLYHTVDGSFNQQSVTAGQRVALSSGFPFTYTDSNGSHFGHIGYWGVWTEEELALTDLADQTITRQQFGASTPEEYTVKVSDGKLMRRTKAASSYAEVVGVDLNWWGDPSNPDCSGPNPCTQADYRATVVDNGSGGYSLMVTDTLAWSGNGGPTLTDITDVDITPVNEWEQRWLWGDSLGGSVVFKPVGETDAVVMFKEEVVSPDEENLPSQLYCYERCLKGGLSASGVTEESDLFHIQWNDNADPQEHIYTLSVVNGQFALADANGAPVAVGFEIPAGAGDWYEWGVNTGEMTASPVDEWWRVFEADVTYRWETGQNSWNRAVAVINNATSQPRSFDKPLHFKYVYALGDDPNGDDYAAGTPFMLEYGGQGELWGFPWIKLDSNCDESAENCRWVSSLTLKNGVVLENGEDYLVLPMESEQSMNAVALSNCSNAGLDVSGISLSLPEAVAGSVDFAWSDKPQVTAAPAVIEGEVQ